MAAAERLEWQIPAGRQRRVGRLYSVRRAGRGVAPRLRGVVNGCGTHGHRCELRDGPSGEAEDFGYRAVHETAVQSKATIANFYGMGPKLSYFNGCSGGGRMAFQEAQRFPADFDAILAGAPGYNRVNQSVWMLMNAKATLDNPASFIPAAKYAVLHRAALDACDAQDGLKDGTDQRASQLPCRSGSHAVQVRRRTELPDRTAGRSGAKALCRRHQSEDGRTHLSASRGRAAS
jgi:hypothetical protein